MVFITAGASCMLLHFSPSTSLAGVVCHAVLWCGAPHPCQQSARKQDCPIRWARRGVDLQASNLLAQYFHATSQ